MSSGENNAQIIAFNLRHIIQYHSSLGAGIFGWTDNHVQASVVARQLQAISQVDLFLTKARGRLSHADRMKSDVSAAVMGAAWMIFLRR